jgi:hypothetical protein
MLVGVQCRHSEKKSLSNEGYGYEFDGKSFMAGDSLYANKLVCFFTNRCCPTCVLEVKKYSESIVNCSDVLFCTDKVDTFNISFYSVISPKVLKVSDVFANIEKPLLFQTDKNGKIYNMLEIEYNKPYEVKEYLLKSKTHTHNY